MAAAEDESTTAPIRESGARPRTMEGTESQAKQLCSIGGKRSSRERLMERSWEPYVSSP